MSALEWHLPDRVLSIGPMPLVMGIVNVTPDSFSDGGLHADTDSALAHGLRLVDEGAELLDIGGVSTRPGANPVSPEEELRRVVPVVAALAKRTRVPLSIDTSKATVARACLESGAHIVNDVTALTGDPDVARTVADAQAAVILMHMQGTPQTMQIAPAYDDVVFEVAQYLESRLQAITEIGIHPGRIALDPGIGFGKKARHNLDLLAHLDALQRLGRPVCLGVSRKGFLGKIVERDVGDRLPASLAALAFALCRQAVQIIRVHDVKETRDFLRTWEAIENRTG
jgi:dihydropteroate synthase